MADAFIPVVINATAFISAQYKQVLSGIKAAAGKAGRAVRVFTEDGFDALDTAAWPPVIIAGGSSLPFLEKVIARMHKEGRRVVLAGTGADQFGGKVSCATHSRRAEIHQVLSYLCRCRRDRIALVGFDEHSINDRFRYHAALTAREELTPQDAYTWHDLPETCFEAFEKNKEKYNAVICPNDMTAVCFAAFCRRKGIRVPEEMYISSFGGSELGRWCQPGITTTRMDNFQVGFYAVLVWTTVKENYATGMTMKITLPCRIIPRESTAFQPDQADLPAVLPNETADPFYSMDPTATLVRLDDCLSRRDELDFKILSRLMAGDSYEEMGDTLFISASALRYRLHKMYQDAGAASRAEFEGLIHGYLGMGNPFAREREEEA